MTDEQLSAILTNAGACSVLSPTVGGQYLRDAVVLVAEVQRLRALAPPPIPAPEPIPPAGGGP